MKKYIVNILFFFAIVTVIDIFVGFVGDYLVDHVKSGDTKRTNDLAMVDKHDVLIMGSSRARHHYDAPFLSDTLGVDVYNAGYDGNGVVLAYGLMEMILCRYRPQLVLFDVEPAFDIEVYDLDNNHKRYISRLKPYYRNTAVGNIIKDVSIEEWYKVQSGMMRYNISIISMIVGLRHIREDDNKGYSPLKGIYEREPTHIEERPAIDPFKLSYINKFILLVQSKGIPLVVVASPKFGQNNSDDIRPVKEICSERGIPLWDYYSDPVFQNHKEWFREPMHLNDKGARIYSRFLSPEIMRLINGNQPVK